MRIKRFTGPTMQEALRQLKTALGPDAVILDTAQAAGAVTVTGAVDEDEWVARSPAARRDRELASEVRELLGVVRELVDARWEDVRPGVRAAARRLHRALVVQGVDGVIAAELVRATAARLEPGAALDAALAGALENEQPRGPQRRVRLFIGPPGDGKTTTLVKLAAHERAAGWRPALISTDTYRVGAAAELETYGRALGVPTLFAADAGELASALARAADADLVLIDTAGATAGPGTALAELGALAEVAGDDAGRILVVSATAGSRAAAETWQAFVDLRPDACVLTKLDLAPGGPVVGLCWRERVPVSHLTAGRGIPHDLEPATPERLARCLLTA